MKYSDYRNITAEELVDLWRCGWEWGDDESKHILINNFTTYMFQLIHKYSSDDPNEVLHDCVLYLYDKLHKYNPDKGKVITYIYRGVRNVIKTRQCKNEIETISIDENYDDSNTTKNTPFVTDNAVSIMNDKEYAEVKRNAVLDVITQLDHEYAKILIDKYIHNMKVQDIADKIGRSRRMTTIYLKEALAQAREVLENKVDDLGRG